MGYSTGYSIDAEEERNRVVAELKSEHEAQIERATVKKSNERVAKESLQRAEASWKEERDSEKQSNSLAVQQLKETIRNTEQDRDRLSKRNNEIKV